MKIKIGVGTILLPIFLAFAGTSRSLILGMAVAVLAHESGHVAAALLQKKKISTLTLEPFGARLVLDGTVSYGQELFIALSGPTVSILLWLLLWRTNVFLPCGEYSLFLGLINLLPVDTLDGGRVLFCATSLFLDYRAAEKILLLCGRLCVFVLWLISVYLVLRYDGGFGLLVFSCFLGVMSFKK